ncbi:Uncharacterised protein [Yersinia pseudotuberculosis]|nr:Uncharacterised protein [Yersinia pseudotuberculosis]CRY71375.1 Uncharacterised protein [Yersinia pseudotuberculosis]
MRFPPWRFSAKVNTEIGIFYECFKTADAEGDWPLTSQGFLVLPRNLLIYFMVIKECFFFWTSLGIAACFSRCHLIRGQNGTFPNIPAKQTVEVIIIITTIVNNLC